jgi:Ser/Thr protein kinase RdoA (MazF antagonist)
VRRAALLTLLRERYGLPWGAASGAAHFPLSLRLLSREGGKRIFRVALSPAGGAALAAGRPPLPWVVRVYPAWRRPAALAAQAALLTLLEARGYPAPRPVLTSGGDPVAALPGGGPAAPARPVLVTTHVPGRMTGLSLPGLRAHGAALGRLHALVSLPPEGPPTASPASPLAALAALTALPPASMLPPAEVRAALSWLAACRPDLPRALIRRHDALEAACHTLHHFRDAPRVLLHNDCHPWNSVRQPGGRVVLIDWEGAGPGPAAIDLGFAALSAATGGVPGPVLPPEPARLDALLDGYVPHHRLSPVELDHLTDAVRFRVLIHACDRFSRTAADGADLDSRVWQRYLAAESVADDIRARLRGASPPAPPSSDSARCA